MFTYFLDETSFFLSKTSIDSSQTPHDIIIMGFSHARRAEDTHEWMTGARDWIKADREYVTRHLREKFGPDFDQSHIWYARYKAGRMLEDLTEF